MLQEIFQKDFHYQELKYQDMVVLVQDGMFIPHFSRPGVIQAAVSKMTNGEKYVCIARTVEKGVGRHGQKKKVCCLLDWAVKLNMLKEFVYTENIDITDKKTEIPIGVSL